MIDNLPLNMFSAAKDLLSVGMCGMDFSSSVRFGFEENRGFGLVLINRRFGFLCRSVVKYKKMCKLSFLCVHFAF